MKLHHILDTSGTYTYVTIPRDILPEVQAWCEAQASPGKFSMGGHGIYFENKDDAAWTKLKWA